MSHFAPELFFSPEIPLTFTYVVTHAHPANGDFNGCVSIYYIFLKVGGMTDLVIYESKC